MERRRLVLTIAPVDWAAEWLRPISPNFKMVGPILSEPGKPLPADLEVSRLPAARQELSCNLPPEKLMLPKCKS